MSTLLSDFFRISGSHSGKKLKQRFPYIVFKQMTSQHYNSIFWKLLVKGFVPSCTLCCIIQLRATNLGLVTHGLLFLAAMKIFHPLTMQHFSLNAAQKSPNENVTRFQYQLLSPRRLHILQKHGAHCSVLVLQLYKSGPVVQRLDNAIHRINRYPVDKC